MIQLVRRAKKKDDQAFVELIDRCKGDLYKVARSYLNSEDDIADAIQETVIDCYEKIGSLREAKYFKTWLTRILINNCNDILRCGSWRDVSLRTFWMHWMRNIGSFLCCTMVRDLKYGRLHRSWNWK